MKKFGGGKNAGGKDTKKKTAPKEVPQPQTWEEYMEEGVLLEEKGERYATGDKARRFYERAGDMYHKACKLNPEDSDCLYNYGRVLYILVDFTTSACQKLTLLNASIAQFRSALVYDDSNVDSLFNLAQALTTHADLIQEHDEDDEDHDHHSHAHKASHLGDGEESDDDDEDEHGNAEEKAALELQEAIAIFEKCYTIQQEELSDAVDEAYPRKKQEHGSSSSTEAKPAALVEQEQKELASNAGVLIDTLISTSQALTSLAFLVDTSDLAKDYYRQASEKLEIALGVAEDELLWKYGSNDQKKKSLTAIGFNKATAMSSTTSLLMQSVGAPADDVLPALKPVAVFREAQASEEVATQREKLCDIHLQYSNLLSSKTDRNFQDSGKISEELYETSLEHLDIVLGLEPRHVEALCDKGDLLGAWAQGLVTFLPASEGGNGLEELEQWKGKGVSSSSSASTRSATSTNDSPLANRIWQLFNLATRAFLSALEVESQNTSILEKLGDIHWSRSLLQSSVAIKNRPTLLNNASVYYRYAWESCKSESGSGGGSSSGAGGNHEVDEDQRLEILLSWAQVLRALPNKSEEVVRVLKQWKRIGGCMEMLQEMLDGQMGDILQIDFVEYVMGLLKRGL